jgi:hypothetical protein
MAADLTSSGRAIMAMNHDLDRSPARGVPENYRSFMVVGNIAAGELSKHLQQPGEQDHFLCCVNWTITADTVIDMAERMLEDIATRPVDTIVFVLLDEDIFLGKEDTGEVGKPFVAGGIWHVAGRLVIADYDTVMHLLHLLGPLFTAAGGRNIILVSPTPRFTEHRCCDDPAHLVNSSDADFITQQKAGLRTVKQAMREFVRANNYRRTRILDPDLSTSTLSSQDLASNSPVLPSEKVFATLAGAVRRMDVAISEQEAMAAPPTTAYTTTSGQHRADSTAGRQYKSSSGRERHRHDKGSCHPYRGGNHRGRRRY